MLFVTIYLIKYVVLCSFPLNKTKLILLAINCNFIYDPNEIIFCHFVIIYSKSSSTGLFHKALLINLHQSNMPFKKKIEKVITLIAGLYYLVDLGHAIGIPPPTQVYTIPCQEVSGQTGRLQPHRSCSIIGIHHCEW